MANKAIDKSYLLQTLKDFNTRILLLFFQKKLTVTTVPSDPENGDVIIYVGSTSGNFVQGHTYKYNTLQTSWVDITPSANSTLAGLTDTTISSPSDGQILKYDNASSKWVNSNEQNVPTAYTSNPAMDGTASPGSSTNWAKGDHVHPSDTSKADNTTSFTEASTRANIASGETIPTILGKIKKYFSDLKDLAYIAKDGASSTKYLKGDGTWDTPTNTTYDAISSSELITGTATTSRTVRADYLKTGINSLIDTKINGLSIPDELADLSDTTITNPTDGQVLAYDDASDKWINSSQQAVNNATLTIRRNGADVATFSSNASVDVTADIAVPAIINNLMATYTGKALDATQGKVLKDRTDINPHWFYRYGSFTKDVPIRFPETGGHRVFDDSYGCQVFPMCDSDSNGQPRKFKSVVVYPQGYCELTPAEDILSANIGVLVFSRPINPSYADIDDAVN